MATRSIVIVGAGAFGLAAALELRARGWQVAVLDQGAVPHPDAASTDISKVVRMDYGADELYTEMAERAIAHWDIWNALWERPLFHRKGFLILTREAEMPAGSFEHASFATLTKRGHPLQRVRRADLGRQFPAWNAQRYGDGYFRLGGERRGGGQARPALPAAGRCHPRARAVRRVPRPRVQGPRRPGQERC
jgi:glycine/D-amino acid oxidase-like deaminating enzyme